MLQVAEDKTTWSSREELWIASIVPLKPIIKQLVYIVWPYWLLQPAYVSLGKQFYKNEFDLFRQCKRIIFRIINLHINLY